MKKIIGSGLIAVVFAFYGTAFAADGAAIFKAKCSPCHGPDGKGTAMAPSFVDNKFLLESKDEQIIEVVKNGRAGAEKHYKQFAIDMPPQGKALSEDDLKAVVDYVKGIAKKK